MKSKKPVKHAVLAPPYHSLSPGVSLYIEKGRADAALPTVEQFERHVDRWGPELTWFVDNKSQRYRPFENRYRDFPRRNLESAIRDDRHCYWSAFSASDHGAARSRVFQATHYGRDPDLSESLFGVHWGDVDATRLLDEALGFARKTRVKHGLGGIFLWRIHSAGLANNYAHEAFAFSARFQGVDFCTPTFSGGWVGGIKTVNWLTFVGSTLLKRVGGERSVRKKLSSQVIVHETLGGVCFQAGAAPLFGDLNAGADLSAYKEVGELLAPIRDREEVSIGQAGPGRFSMEEYDAWRARFDRRDHTWRPKLGNPYQPQEPEHEDLLVKEPLGPKIREAMHEGRVPVEEYAEVYAFGFEGRLKEQLPYAAVAYHGCGGGFWDKVEAYMAEKMKADPALKARVKKAKAAATERVRKRIEEADQKAAAPKRKTARKQPKRDR